MRIDLYKDLYNTENTHWWHRAKREFVKNLITRYIKKQKPTILDVGCGTGKNMEELSVLGDVWGVDVSKDALNFCKERGLVQVKWGKAEELPYNANTFDCVCILDVLEHVDDEKAIKEINRVLKNDGFLVISVPAFSWLWSSWDVVLHHKRRYTTMQIEQILTKRGFIICRNTYVHSFLLLPVLLIRKIKELTQQTQYSSDFQINNATINTVLSFVSKLEQMWINRYDMPFGTSVLCIAEKKAH